MLRKETAKTEVSAALANVQKCTEILNKLMSKRQHGYSLRWKVASGFFAFAVAGSMLAEEGNRRSPVSTGEWLFLHGAALSLVGAIGVSLCNIMGCLDTNAQLFATLSPEDHKLLSQTADLVERSKHSMYFLDEESQRRSLSVFLGLSRTDYPEENRASYSDFLGLSSLSFRSPTPFLEQPLEYVISEFARYQEKLQGELRLYPDAPAVPASTSDSELSSSSPAAPASYGYPRLLASRPVAREEKTQEDVPAFARRP